MSLRLDHTLNRRTVLTTDQIARLERMLEIRYVEETVQRLFAEGLVAGSTHTCQGQEAVAVALASATRPDDVVTCTYRGHGIALALGMDPVQVLAEILGRASGCIGGVGGSMHLSDHRIGLMPTFAIVGAGIPVAVGAALAAAFRGSDAIGVAVFGDGATNIGAFHEGLNLARVWEAPVLFLCENNLYAEYSRIDRTTPFEDLYRRAAAYDMPSRPVDGQDLDQLIDVLTDEVAQIRARPHPRFVEAKTYRFVGHSRSDPATYRPPGELDQWLTRDPVTLTSQALLASGVATEKEISELDEAANRRVSAAEEAARSAPEPELSAMFTHVWPEQTPI